MSKIIQRCPTDVSKLLNPTTGRCVLESNATIKKLLREGWTIIVTGNIQQPEPPRDSGIKILKVCPTDSNKLINPESGRCVKHNNSTIQKLLKEGWVIAFTEQRIAPVVIKKYGNISNWKKLKSILDKNRDSIVSINEYLATTEITPIEEREEKGQFITLYSSENLIKFLREEVKSNLLIKRSTCLGGKIRVYYNRNQPSSNRHLWYTTSPSMVRNMYTKAMDIDNAILFNTPESNSYERKQMNILMYDKLNNILNSCTQQYFIIPLTLTEGSFQEYYGFVKNPIHAHANVLIFDTKNKTIERFDPQGSFSYTMPVLSKDPKYTARIAAPGYDSVLIDHYLNIYFKTQLPDYKYKYILYSCPYLGPQVKADVGSGYCVTWVIMYTFLRLLNPNIPPGTVNRILINDKVENIKIKLKKFAKYYSDIIKNAN